MLTPPPTFTGTDMPLAATVFGIDADVFAGWGQWAGAIGSIAAVIVALSIAMRDGRLRDRERRDQESAQARLVTVGRDLIKTVSTRLTRAGAQKVESNVPGIVIENHSAFPVSAVSLVSVVPSKLNGTAEPGFVITIGIDEFDSKRPLYVSDVLGPGDRVELQTLITPAPGQDREALPEGTLITIEFTDAVGLRWRRVGVGNPDRQLDDAIARSRRRLQRPRSAERTNGS
ncbi:hypothetical protein [Amycolatopsis sp. NPDC059657]|uniref:hypothetical protein n=1 Tax=Amycolatopsis sp. NPDC059657 TaxID=3346899 RepID=UPI00366FB1EE